MNKFMTHGEFNTLKTAQNTWGKIKSKLISVAGEAKPEEGDAAANGKFCILTCTFLFMWPLTI